MSSILWKYANQIDLSLIRKFEHDYQISFPVSFANMVSLNNYGYPSPCKILIFGRMLSIKCLLSFDKNDSENIWDFSEAVKSKSINAIPFALDNFGNLFVFQLPSMSIGFFDHEESEIEPVCKDFNSFLDLISNSKQ